MIRFIVFPYPAVALCLFILTACCATGGQLMGDPQDPYPLKSPPRIGQIVHLATGHLVTPAQMLAVAGDSRIVYVGETHDNPASHRLEVQILQGLAERHPGRIALGMEMFVRSQQPVLDRWSAGLLDEKTFLKESHAFTLLPGGFGTMDEGYEALTLMQTGKSQLMPLVLVDKPGGTYWKTWDQHIREHLLRDRLISAEDLNLYQITDSADEAVKIITRFYRNFYSTRWVKDALVIRLRHAPSASALAALNEDFADIISGESIRLIPPTPEELEDTQHLDLPRIAFGFNRKDYGRLRQLIDVLNGL